MVNKSMLQLLKLAVMWGTSNLRFPIPTLMTQLIVITIPLRLTYLEGILVNSGRRNCGLKAQSIVDKNRDINKIPTRRRQKSDFCVSEFRSAKERKREREMDNTSEVPDQTEVTSFTESFSRFHIPKLIDALPELQEALQEHGISYTLNLDELYMTVSTTPRTIDPDIIHRAREIIVLLSKTTVPAYVVIDILNGHMHHDYIKTGYQEGGLAAIHGIKEARFIKRRTRFMENLKDLARLIKFHLYVNGNTVTAAGTSLEQVKVVRMVVKRCFVENVDPATVVSRLNMRKDINNMERKLSALVV